MYDSDREIIQTALSWLKQGYQLTFITVLKTWGSSPRPAGSLMIIRDDGLHAGSVSGGCVEEDLFSRVLQKQFIEDGNIHHPKRLFYGNNAQQTSAVNIPCGGQLELLVEHLEGDMQFEVILNKVVKGELVARRVCLSTGEVSLHAARDIDEFSYHESISVTKVFGASWHMLLIGAGHLSQYVTQMGLMLDYRVNVCDPREEYQSAWPYEEVLLLKSMPDEAVKSIRSIQRTIVLGLSHDPKLDDMALMEALNQSFFYVGALGSIRNNDNRRLRLAELGLSPQKINKLHGPVGLSIGSRTPAEIALSIMADITAVRHGAIKAVNNTVQGKTGVI